MAIKSDGATGAAAATAEAPAPARQLSSNSRDRSNSRAGSKQSRARPTVQMLAGELIAQHERETEALRGEIESLRRRLIRLHTDGRQRSRDLRAAALETGQSCPPAGMQLAADIPGAPEDPKDRSGARGPPTQPELAGSHHVAQHAKAWEKSAGGQEPPQLPSLLTSHCDDACPEGCDDLPQLPSEQCESELDLDEVERRGRRSQHSLVSMASALSCADVEEIIAIQALGTREEELAEKWEKRMGSSRSRSAKLSKQKRLFRSASNLLRLQTAAGFNWSRSVALRIVSWWCFDLVIGVVIVANALVLGIQTSAMASSGQVPIWVKVLEAVFLTVYIGELWLRIHATGLSALRSGWVKFDAFLVVAGVLDAIAQGIAAGIGTYVVEKFTIIRLLRIMRVLRSVRLLALAQFHSLWLLIQGIMSSLHPMLWTFVIMLFQIYAFALLGMELVRPGGGRGGEYDLLATIHFGDLGRSMLTMLQLMTVDSVAGIYAPLILANPVLVVYFAAYIMIGSITLMNLVTGIMVESSIRQAREDQDAQRAWETMKRNQMRPKLVEMFRALDTNDSGELELHELLNAPEPLQEQLNRICQMDDIEDTFRILDHDDSGSVDADEFCAGIMRVAHKDKPAELVNLLRQTKDIQARTRVVSAWVESQRGGRKSALFRSQNSEMVH